jgi:hypothetical protein
MVTRTAPGHALVGLLPASVPVGRVRVARSQQHQGDRAVSCPVGEGKAGAIRGRSMSDELGRTAQKRTVELSAQLRLWSDDSGDTMVNSHCCDSATDSDTGQMGHEQLRSPESNGNSGFRDSAFKKNKELPLHRWVPWIAGFSAEFVEDCLNKYLLPRNGERER